MRGALVIAALALLGLAVFTLTPPRLYAGAVVGTPAPDFMLADQYDQRFRLREARGQIVLMVCGDRKGSRFMGHWIRPVNERLESDSASSPSIRVVRIANLKGVPGILHGMVRGRFTGLNTDGLRKPAILLDWKGVVAQAYGFTADATNVYLVDGEGLLRHVASGRGEAGEVEALIRALEIVIEGP